MGPRTVMLRRLRIWTTLPAADRALVMRAVVGLPWTALRLRVGRWGLARRQGEDSAESPPPKLARARHVADLVNRTALALPRPPTCLTRSVYLISVLNQEQIAASLRIGVRKPAGRLEAHAWVEVAGEVVNDSAAVTERFAPFPGPLAAVVRAMR